MPSSNAMPKCVLCLIKYYEDKKLDESMYRMSLTFYNRILADLEHKISHVKKLGQLHLCTEHYVIGRRLREAQFKCNEEDYQALKLRIRKLQTQIELSEYKFIPAIRNDTIKFLSPESRIKIRTEITHLKRVMGQLNRTLETLERNPRIAAKTAETRATILNQERKSNAPPQVIGHELKLGNGGTLYLSDTPDMPDLGADCFSSSDSGNSGGKDGNEPQNN